MRGALSYNEQKVSQGKAELILAYRFSRDISEMGFSEKLLRFEKLSRLNTRTRTNTLHLSLNFSPDDKLNAQTLQKIAADYMERIGFSEQPYLVYQHKDTAHPHLHIVATTIKTNGKAIYLHNIGKTKSEPARKAIELEYGLVVANRKVLAKSLPLQPVPLQEALYGKGETKRLISNIVLEIIGSYKYGSLDELNAVLRQYNVMADGGAEGSRIRKHQGLTYSLLDKRGNKIGVPIKASTIYTSPTLSSLQKKMQKNLVKKVVGREHTGKIINDALYTSKNAGEFFHLLRQNQIRCVFDRSNTQGEEKAYFIDNRKRLVFTNGELSVDIDRIRQKLSVNKPSRFSELRNIEWEKPEYAVAHNFSSEIIKDLLSTETAYDTISPEFLKKKRRKKRTP